MARSKYKSKCDCVACRAGSDPTAAYMVRHYSVFERVLSVDGGPTTEEENLIKRSQSMLGMTNDVQRLISACNSYTAFDLTHPGYLLLARVDGEGEILDGPVMQLLDLWDVNLSDAGVAQIRGYLAKANALRLERSQPPLNLALWITGIFEPVTPVHGVVVDEFSAIGVLFEQLEPRCMAISLVPQALETQRTEILPLVANATGGPSRDQRTLNTLLATSRLMVELSVRYKATRGKHAKALKAFESELVAQRIRITTQADERRKAAVNAKKRELDVCRARVLELTTQLGAAQRRLREREAKPLEAELPAAPNAAPPVSPAPPSPAIEPAGDEFQHAAMHWQETAEHQAVVLRELRLVVRHLQSSNGQEAHPADHPPPSTPRKLSELGDWAAENADRVIILKRAQQAARKSNYEDEELVFKALDMLATTYRDVKLGLADRMAYQQACESLGLDMGGSIDMAISDSYYFDWKGRRTFLDQHLGRGIARDPRYCLRIYFTWDAEEAKVIIGWLPSHLPTRAT